MCTQINILVIFKKTLLTLDVSRVFHVGEPENRENPLHVTSICEPLVNRLFFRPAHRGKLEALMGLHTKLVTRLQVVVEVE